MSTRSDLVVRRATEADLPALQLALYDAAHPPGFERPALAEALAQHWFSHYLDGWPRPGDVGVVAEQDGRPIGAAWCRLFPSDDPGFGWVDAETPEVAIAVTDGHRGGGVGRAMLRGLADAARSAGYDRLCLSVSQSNPKAVALYLTEGYRAVAVDGGFSLTMVLPLTTS